MGSKPKRKDVSAALQERPSSQVGAHQAQMAQYSTQAYIGPIPPSGEMERYAA